MPNFLDFDGVKYLWSKIKKNIDPLDERITNIEENVSSIQAVIDNVAPPQNLLINGDFKIWQRGTTFSDIANQYTADMWRIENAAASVALVERSTDVPSNADCNYSIHIKDTQSNPNFYLMQKGMNFKGSFVLSFWYKSNKNFPTYYIDGSGTHLLGVNEPSSEWKYVSYKFSSNNLSTFNIIQGASNGDFYIASVRLYRGEIDYPHVEEDDAIALLRCQNWVIWGEIPSNAPSNVNTTTGVIEARVSFPIKMKSVPTVKVYDLQNNEDKITRVNIGFDSADNSVVSGIVSRNTGFIVTSSGTYKANALSGYYLATREPL